MKALGIVALVLAAVGTLLCLSIYPNLHTTDPFSLTGFARFRFGLGVGVWWLLLLCALVPFLVMTIWSMGQWVWAKIGQRARGWLGRATASPLGNIMFGILVFVTVVPLFLSLAFAVITPPLWLSGELLAPLEAHRLGNAITGDRELKPRCLLFEDAENLIVFGVYPWRFFDPSAPTRFGVARWRLRGETETIVSDSAPACKSVGWSADRSAFWLLGADNDTTDRLVAFDRGGGQRAQWQLPPAPGRKVASAACLSGETWITARGVADDDKKITVRLDSGGADEGRFATLADPGVLTGVALSPRCQWLAVSNTGGVQVYPLEALSWQKTSSRGEAPTGREEQPTLTVKDAKKVLLTEGHLLRFDEGHLEIWALAEGRQVDALPASALVFGRIARAATGLRSTEISGDLIVREARSGRVIARYPSGFFPIALDPTGQRVAMGAVGSIRVWDVPEAPASE